MLITRHQSLIPCFIRRVQIEFGEKNIKVIHKKKERSHIDEPSQYFGFEWSMGFNFSKKLSVLNIQVQILDWYFKPEIRPEIKYTLGNIIIL